MNRRDSQLRRPHWIHLLLLVVGLACVLACGGPVRAPLMGRAGNAQLEGLVTVETIEGAERLVTVSVGDLPPPARLNPDLRTYVVWFVGDPAAPIRAGALIYEPELREGRLHAATELDRFQLKITAERSASAASPSEHVIVDQWVDEG